MANDLSGLRIPQASKADPAPRRRIGWTAWMMALFLLVVAGGGVWWWTQHRWLEVEAGTVIVQRESSGLPILSATGYLTAHRQVIVSAKTPGRVARILVDEGDRVQEGELMAELEASELKAALARAHAEYEEAERQYRRYQNLWKDQIVAQAEMDRVATQYKVAKAAMELQMAQLENMMIRAPFGGTVLKKHIEVGQMLSAGSLQDGGIAAFTLADLDRLDVNVDVSEGNIQKIALNHPVEVVAEALPDKILRGRVIKIAPTANRQKAIVEVTVRILDRDPRLKPEMSVKVTFVERESPQGKTTSRVLVPKRAVWTEGKGQFVWVVEGTSGQMTIRRRPVVCQKEWTQYWEVTKGLVGGEQVVMDGDSRWTEGRGVKLKVQP